MPRELATAESAAVHRLIRAVARRRWLARLAAAGLVTTVVVVSIGLVWPAAGPPGLRIAIQVMAALVWGGAALVRARRSLTRGSAAVAIERVRPACRNLVITAEELERHPERASSFVRDRIFDTASQALHGLRPRDVVSLRAAAFAVLASTAIALLSTAAARQSIRQTTARASHALPLREGVPAIRVTIEAPGYTGRPAVVVSDPAQIEALEGSRMTFELPADWRLRFGDARIEMNHVAAASGYFALESASAAHERRLIPLNVIPDRAPAVRINAPARDLLLTDGSRAIPVTVAATDDMALQALELRYTKVSGSGEQFEFMEGTLPITIDRKSAREWTADVQLALPPLRLGPGDSLVYRAVARDARPGGAGLASSDTYVVEIAGPGQVALEGVDMPPDIERYAMSQQMIVLKLERLQKRARSMTGAERSEEAGALAAEQRTVRASFVFLLGGHVEDEEEEAAQSHEIQEGRLENTARRDIDAAISHMSRAEQGITALDFSAALPPARAAVESLQRAFGRARYLLRALPGRSRPDPSRRLAGDLSDAADWTRRATPSDERPGQQVRELFTRLTHAAGAQPGATPDRATLQQLAEAALAIDPTSAHWQNVARTLLDVSDVRSWRSVISRVSSEALRSTVSRTPMSTRISDLERAFWTETRR